ncbi:MAG: hypothetical protein ACRDB9_06515 [Cetobacterium sp.]
MKYRIGLYNSKLENEIDLKENCNVVYDNTEQLYKHLRKDDILVLNSFISVFGVESKLLREKIEEFNLTIEYKNNVGLVSYCNIFTLNINLALIELIIEEKEQFKKLLEIIQ